MSVTRGSRKTRIVCISDTHNQTPKLPQGDVLIHAGDLTNQGSYSELKKAVEWLEKQDFEAKIVIAGNHEITLDEPFFRQNQGSWKWPCEQDPGACRRLLVESKSITYLENTTTTVRLGAKGGPRTEFSVFGSPCTPKQGNWAFQYEADEAEHVWDKIPQGVDIVVTHTPPKGHCDGTGTDWQDGRGGCAALQRRLSKIRPKLSVCGHIHGGRGVETVRWRTGARDQATEGDSGRLVESVEFWNDPGRANKKLSVVDLTTGSRAGRRLGSSASLPRQGRPDSGQEHVGRAGVVAGAPDSTCQQPRSGDGQRIGVGTLSLTACALDPDVGNSEALWGRGGGEEETWSHAQGRHVEPSGRAAGMETTTVVNAAYLGGRRAGKAHGQHKPVVVDLDMDTAGGLW